MDEGPPETEYQTRSYQYKCVSFCNFTLYNGLTRARSEAMVPSADFTLVSLETARATNPRPPSPTTAAATQRKQRRENLRQLSLRGEVSLTKMQSMPSFHSQADKTSGPSRAGSISSELMTKAVVPLSPITRSKAPVRPPRDARRKRPHHEVRGLIPPFAEFIPTNFFYSGFLSLLLRCHANRTSSQNRASPSGKMAIFRAHR
jgi:hypothetical protein